MLAVWGLVGGRRRRRTEEEGKLEAGSPDAGGN